MRNSSPTRLCASRRSALHAQFESRATVSDVRRSLTRDVRAGSDTLDDAFSRSSDVAIPRQIIDTRRMLALTIDREVRLRTDYPEPKPKRGEAVLDVRLAGICDTDLQICRGYHEFSGVMGHEFVGQVRSATASELQGKRVVCDINGGCGTCAECRAFGGHHCANRGVVGIVGRDGAFAERIAVPEPNLVVVPDEVTDEQAVFAEPLAAALHVLDVVTPGANTLVLGDGKLGLLIAFAMKGAGQQVLLAGHHHRKLSIAEGVGIETCLEQQLSDQRFDAVVEATGSATGFERALGLVRPKGTLVLKTTVADRIAVDLSALVVNEIQLVGSRCGDLGRAVEFMRRERIDLSELIAERHALRDGVEAIRRAGEPGTLKVLLEPGR